MEQNKACPLRDTKYCRMLNQPGCARCCLPPHPDYVRVCESLDRLSELLPEGGISDLFTDKDCRFCCRRRHHGYAILYMANPEPEGFLRDVMGDTKGRPGALIPLQFGICDTCRMRFILLSKLPKAVPLFLAVIGLLVLYTTGLTDRVMGVGFPVEFAALGGIVLLSWTVCRFIRDRLAKKFATEMYTDILDHPKVREMKAKGWVPLTEGTYKGLRFSTSRISRGPGTAESV